MNVGKEKVILFCAMATVMILLAACSQTVTVNGPGSNPTTTSSLSSLQVLQKSADAMKQLKSSHVDLQSSNSLQTTGAAASSTPSASATTTASQPNNVNFSMKGSGDQSFANQEQQLQLTINAANTTLNVAEIVQGDNVYVQNAQGQWYVLNKSDLQGMVANPLSSASFDENSLLGLIQDSKITDYGTQTLNGQSLRHISASLDKTALRQLATSSPQLQSIFGQQDINTVLNNTKQFVSTIDVWIDEAQFYVHRTELKLNLLANTSAVGNGAPSSVTVALDTIADLSKFNETVNITPPTNAIPTHNPGVIFGIGKP